MKDTGSYSARRMEDREVHLLITNTSSVVNRDLDSLVFDLHNLLYWELIRVEHTV